MTPVATREIPAPLAREARVGRGVGGEGRLRAFAIVAVAALALALSACSSGSTEKGSAPPKLVSAEARRDVVSGTARQSTTITVKFDRAFVLSSKRLPLASYFELELADPRASQPQRALVKTAKIDGDSNRSVTLTVDRLIPQDSKLKVAKKAFARDAPGDLEIAVASDMSEIGFILATNALEFTDPKVFDEAVIAPVTDADRDPAAMRKVLEQHFDARKSPEEMKKAGLAAYDQIAVATVPSPKARAALAALTGTFAEAALQSLFSNDNCTGKPAALIAFQPPPELPDLLARATLARDGRRIISLNPKIEGERIEPLMSILAHEAIHCDNKGSRIEEVASTSFDTFFYLEMLSAFPELPATGTVLVRELNINALAMINSGARYPESVGILRSAGFTTAVPGTSAPYPSFGDLVVAAYSRVPEADSPEEPVAHAYVVALAARSGLTPKSAFDIRYLDELLGRSLDIRTLTLAIQALKLAPV